MDISRRPTRTNFPLRHHSETNLRHHIDTIMSLMPFAQGRDAGQIAKEINIFNTINKEETKEAGAHYVDITPISREAVNDVSLIASDGLHPSGKMYAMWAEEVLSLALEVLSKEGE